MSLPSEILLQVVEHLPLLADWAALYRSCRQMACLCSCVSLGQLWGLMLRSCRERIRAFPMREHWMERKRWPSIEWQIEKGFLDPSDPREVPFKVCEWLYRRESRRCFGRSEESLFACRVSPYGLCDRRNPYRWGVGKLGLKEYSVDSCNWADAQAEEWETIWRTFTIYLTMQRVQRVNRGDPDVKEYWRAEFWKWHGRDGGIKDGATTRAERDWGVAVEELRALQWRRATFPDREAEWKTSVFGRYS